MDSEENKQHGRDLFSQAMSDVRPLNPSNRIEPVPNRQPVRSIRNGNENTFPVRDEIPTALNSGNSEPGGDLLFLRPGYPKQIMKRLRRGYYEISDKIDLHGMDQQTAQKVLRDFLTYSSRRGFDCVCVIHGKGLRSANEPVIKNMTRKVLLQHPGVVAFISCRPEDGGTGAVNILLGKRE